MNVHDSERIAGSLDAAGYIPAEEGSDPDLVVFSNGTFKKWLTLQLSTIKNSGLGVFYA